MFLTTYGKLRSEAGSSQIDSKNYSFYPLGHQSKVNMTLRQRMIPDSVFFGSYTDDENNLAVGILNALKKVRPM
jgi:hypothetical protein